VPHIVAQVVAEPAWPRRSRDRRQRAAAGVPWQVRHIRPRAKGCPVMAVRVYLGGAPAAHSEMTYDDADAFSVTAGGFLLIQRQHSGEQKDLAVFAPSAWLHAEVVREPAPGSR